MKRQFAPYTWCDKDPVSIFSNPGHFSDGEDYFLDRAAELGVKLEPSDTLFSTSLRVGDVFDVNAIPTLNPKSRQYSYFLGLRCRNNDEIQKATFIEEGRVGWELIKFLQDKAITPEEQHRVQAVLNEAVQPEANYRRLVGARPGISGILPGSGPAGGETTMSSHDHEHRPPPAVPAPLELRGECLERYFEVRMLRLLFDSTGARSVHWDEETGEAPNRLAGGFLCGLASLEVLLTLNIIFRILQAARLAVYHLAGTPAKGDKQHNGNT